VACLTAEAQRTPLLVLEKGRPAAVPFFEAVAALGPGDVFVKGANAVDPAGRAGILAGNPGGGTIGRSKPYLVSSGAALILPIGLEKMIPSVPDAAAFTVWEEIDAAIGCKTNLLPIDIPGQKVITEIEALAILTGVKAKMLGAGGIGGSEGAVTLGVIGEPKQVRAALDLVKSIKGEPAAGGLRQACSECEEPCDMVR
jgi:hypothetical protein